MWVAWKEVKLVVQLGYLTVVSWVYLTAGLKVYCLVASKVLKLVGRKGEYLAALRVYLKAGKKGLMLAAQRALRKVAEMAASRADWTVVWTVDL